MLHFLRNPKRKNEKEEHIMKKFLALLLVGIMLMSTILAGCGNTAADPTEGKTTEAPVVDSGDNTPVATGDNKLTIAIQTDALITDYDDNTTTKHFEEKLGIEIEFILLSADEFNTKVALWASSGEDLPDILLGTKLTDANAITNYGQEEYFLNVGEYLKDASKMPNFNAIPDEDREAMLNAMTMPDGNIYSFPYSVENPWNLTPYRYYINRAWLDKLDLEVPTTLDELKEVLIAFRDEDPNGNGIKDEMPLYGATSISGSNVLYSLMNSFTFLDAKSENCYLEVDGNGNLYAPYTTDEWKKGLEFMHELYAEGLLAPGVFTDDLTQFKAVLNAETNVVGLVPMQSYGNWTSTATNPNFLEMEMMAPMTGPDGVCYTSYYDYEPVPKGFIFADSDNIDLAIRFMDECYDPQTAHVMRYGVEGVHWTTDPAELPNYTNCYIEDGLYDLATIALYENIWSQSHNHTWRDVAPRYQSVYEVLTVADLEKATFDPAAPANLQAFNMAHYFDKHPEVVVPKALKFTAEESKQVQDAAVNLPDYVDQAMAEFVTGLRDFDAGWTQYLAELENIGLSEYIKVAQAAYDRTLN